MLMTPEAVREALQDRNLAAVARATDISYDTVKRYAREEIQRPDVKILQALTDYLQPERIT